MKRQAETTAKDFEVQDAQTLIVCLEVDGARPLIVSWYPIQLEDI